MRQEAGNQSPIRLMLPYRLMPLRLQRSAAAAGNSRSAAGTWHQLGTQTPHHFHPGQTHPKFKELRLMKEEYGFGSKISTEGDVYSYGVIILEMLTGKCPTDEMFKDGLSLYKFVEDSFPEKICEILDPRISIPYYGNRDEEEAVSILLDQENRQTVAGKMNCISALIKLGLLCAAETPKDRPAMQDVYVEVTAIKEAFSALQG